jgi:plastocyanin
MNKAVLATIVAGIALVGFLIAPIALQNSEAARIKRVIETKQLTSEPHAWISGHESHQAVKVLTLQNNVVYAGRLTFKADKSVDVIILHPKGSFAAGKPFIGSNELNGMEFDAEVYSNVGTEGSFAFNNAMQVELHNTNGDKFEATVTVYYQARAVTGELPEEQVEMPRTIVVSEFTPWFMPNAMQVNPGTPIIWDASDTATVHTITFVTRITDLQLNQDPEYTAKTFTILAPGNRSPVFKPDAGVYVYVCAIHPYMTGIISAGVPLNAITGEKGTGPGDITVEKFAPWLYSPGFWPSHRSEFKPKPSTPGVGEIWIDAQFDTDKLAGDPTGKLGKPWPGNVVVVDAKTWEVKKKITQGLNNPHNLWESVDGKYIAQTNWHDDYITIIDTAKKEIVKNYIKVGEAPAHIVVSSNNKWLVTSINGESRFVAVNAQQAFDPNIPADQVEKKSIPASVPMAGPHGFWLTKDNLIAAPYHMANYIAVVQFDAENGTGKELFVQNAAELPDLTTDDPNDKLGPGIPIASYIGPEINGHRYWATSWISLNHRDLLQGRLILYDIGSAVGGPSKAQLVDIIPVNGVPIQAPISPDGKWLVQANSGGLPGLFKDGKAAITVIKLNYDDPKGYQKFVLPGYPGSHGVSYGYKQGGGLYAYVTAKFAPVLRVVDISGDTPEIAGDVDIDSWGGMGLIALPNANWYATPEENPVKAP